MDSLELSLACANLPVSAHDFNLLEVLSNGSILMYTDNKWDFFTIPPNRVGWDFSWPLPQNDKNK